MKQHIPRTPYTTKRHALRFKQPSLTKQAFKQECDIINILNQYAQTGVITHLASREPQYLDLPSHTFLEAMNIVRDAEQTFADLPAKIRARFRNPSALLEFLEDPSNFDEAASLGLIEATPPPSPEIAATAIVEPPSPPPE